jgi:hypothetical protein
MAPNPKGKKPGPGLPGVPKDSLLDSKQIKAAKAIMIIPLIS